MNLTSQSFWINIAIGFLSNWCQLAGRPLPGLVFNFTEWNFKVYTLKEKRSQRLDSPCLFYNNDTLPLPKRYMAYVVCVPKYLHQEAESKQNMLNKIQLNLLQKRYSKRAYSKCKYNKILPSITDFSSVLFAFPSKTTIASFVFIGKIDFFHPNLNSILKIVGNRTQDVRITRYVGFPIFTYFGNPATKIHTG